MKTSVETAPGLTRTPFRAGRAWTVTILLLAFMLLNFADKATLGFAGVQIKEDLGITAEQFGLVQSAFFWLFAAGSILVGALSSKINVRWLVAGMMFVWILTMAPLLTPVSFGVLMLCRIVLGFAEGPAYAMATHIVHSWFPADKRGLPAGVVTAGASLGPLIAAPVLTWVIVTWNWHAAFGVLIALGLLWLVAWFLFSKDAPEEQYASEETAEAGLDLPPLAPLRALLTSGTVIGIALLTFFSYWSTTLKVSWLPLYLSEGLGYGTIEAGRLITLPYAFAAVFAITAGLFSNFLTARGMSRRVSRGVLTGALIVGSGGSMYLFTVIEPGLLQMLLIALAFSLNTAAYAVAFVAIGDLVHPKKRGTVLGCLVAFYSLAGVLAPLVLGFYVGRASDIAAGYGQGFALTGLLMVVGGILATFLVRPERDLAKLANLKEFSS